MKKINLIILLCVGIIMSSCSNDSISSNETLDDGFENESMMPEDDDAAFDIEGENADLEVNEEFRNPESDDQFIVSENDYADFGEYVKYVTKPGDTLMQVAFNAYGEYLRWREVLSVNSDVLNNNTQLRSGMTLKLKKPLRPYISPSGKPYLIKRGDSLSIISNKVYGVINKWTNIWHNNPKQILNPNLIFAGFTLFYPSMMTGSELAITTDFKMLESIILRRI